jgi:hypothetical protein
MKNMGQNQWSVEPQKAIVEQFVEADVAADFLHRSIRWVMQAARDGLIPAHPYGKQRKRWYFLLSELAEDLRGKVNSPHGEAGRDKTQRGVY